MRGFLLGTLGLIALGVAVQNRRAGAAAEAGRRSLIGLLQRAISPGVAGVPQRKGASA